MVRYLALLLIFGWFWMGNCHKNIQLMLEFPKAPLFVHWKNAGKTQLVSFDLSNDTGAINVKMDGSVLEEKSSFKMLGLTFSSKLDWSFCIISIAKITSKKIGALIRSMKFLSPEVALYLHNSTILPYIEYCCHVMAVAPSCYLEFLDKLQNGYARLLVLHLLLLSNP